MNIVQQAKAQMRAEQAAAEELFRQRNLLDIARRELATAEQLGTQKHSPERLTELRQKVAEIEAHIAELEAAS